MFVCLELSQKHQYFLKKPYLYHLPPRIFRPPYGPAAWSAGCRSLYMTLYRQKVCQHWAINLSEKAGSWVSWTYNIANQRSYQRWLDRRIYKTEMKLWAVLGSRGCREEKLPTAISIQFFGVVFSTFSGQFYFFFWFFKNILNFF